MRRVDHSSVLGPRGMLCLEFCWIYLVHDAFVLRLP
jgi:hypothetical protein